MSEHIPEAAVEAAIRAAYDAFPQTHSAGGPAKTYEECYGHSPLEALDDVAEMRVALAAALPHLVSEEAVERHARASEADYCIDGHFDHEQYKDEARRYLRAALGIQDEQEEANDA